MKHFYKLNKLVVLLAFVLMAVPQAFGLGGPDMGEGQLASVLDDGRNVVWQLAVPHSRVWLSVSTPCGVFHRVYEKGEDPRFSLDEIAPDNPDGVYTWQIRIEPIIDGGIQEILNEARAAGDTETPKELWRKGLLPQGPFIQTGEWGVLKGEILPPETEEEPRGLRAATGQSVAAGDPDAGGSPLERVISQFTATGDLYVYNSACIGFDCVNNGESFGADTIRLKENNLRIHVDDTSTAASFPNQDWRLEFNSNLNGGAEYFRVIDVTASRNIMTVEANAPSNSLVVDSGGRIGNGTANPVVEIHTANGDTPTLRLEQTTASGFAAQTWDVAGNETSFFVRDATNGSTLPFRIFPGASSGSLIIASDDNIGIGTTSPDARLDIESSGDTEMLLTKTGTNSTTFRVTATTNNAFFGTDTNDVMALVTNSVERMRITTAGRVAIGCQNPAGDFDVQSTADAVTDCATAPFSSLTAGNTQFTASSSRTLKENLSPIEPSGVLDRLLDVSVYNYDFIGGPKDRLGLMAEDFHQIFQRGSDKMIDGQDVQMALWLAVQELAAENRSLLDRLAELETRISTEPATTDGVGELE